MKCHAPHPCFAGSGACLWWGRGCHLTAVCPSVPTAAPANFRLINVTTGHEAEFTWDPVDNGTLRGEFLGYKVSAAVWYPWSLKKSIQPVGTLATRGEPPYAIPGRGARAVLLL